MAEPVETKVTVASVAAAIASFVVSILVIKIPAVAGFADLAQAAIIAALTTGATYLAGWWAKHSPRPSDNQAPGFRSM